MQTSTKILHSIPADKLTGAISIPIYQTSTFVQQQPGVHLGYDYSRTNNPTRKILEDVVASLESASYAYAFASGLAAIDAVLKLLNPGDEIIATDDIYGGAFRLFTHIYAKYGIVIHYTDCSDLIKLKEKINHKTKLIWLESPTNPCLKIADIKAIADIAKTNNILLCVDNTFASPVSQQAIVLGADIVVHSATKYLSGHSDLIAGVVITDKPEIAEKIKFIQNASGAILGPFDSWLVIRGIETLDLRIKQHSKSAQQIAEYLLETPEVNHVNYPGLDKHIGHDIAKKQQKYFGGIISFDFKLDRVELAKKICL